MTDDWKQRALKAEALAAHYREQAELWERRWREEVDERGALELTAELGERRSTGLWHLARGRLALAVGRHTAAKNRLQRAQAVYREVIRDRPEWHRDSPRRRQHGETTKLVREIARRWQERYGEPFPYSESSFIRNYLKKFD